MSLNIIKPYRFGGTGGPTGVGNFLLVSGGTDRLIQSEGNNSNLLQSTLDNIILSSSTPSTTDNLLISGGTDNILLSGGTDKILIGGYNTSLLIKSSRRILVSG